MNAWLFQDHHQKQKLGDKCPWSVGWLDPDGTRRSKRLGSRSMAEKHARKIEGQLAAGTYEAVSSTSWDQFTNELEANSLASMNPGTREIMQCALNHFVRIVRPVKMKAITSRTIAEFVAVRRTEPSRPKAPSQQPVSPATVNRDLRCIRVALRKAVRWGFMAKSPEIEFLKEPGKLPTYMAPEHFAKLYGACESARWPESQPYATADWWRGLLVSAYMTGWRIGSLLALRWADVDLEAATAVSRADDNKGNRDQLVSLHPLMVDHIRRLKTFSTMVFPWNHGRRDLYKEFHAIQAEAGIKRTGAKPFYGFHDLRRAFATMNADKLTPDALQALMQHKDYQTTQRYINMARQLNPAVAALYVPALPTVARA